jgi:hypothetical protein
MLIIHKNSKHPCNGEVSVDLSAIFGIFSEVTFTPRGIVVRNSSIESRGSKSDFSKIVFVCKTCSEELTTKEIAVCCNHCYKYFSVEDLVITKELGGVYCKSGATKLFGREVETIPLLDVINKREVLIVR